MSLLADELYERLLKPAMCLLLAVDVAYAIDFLLGPLVPKRDTLCPF